MLGQWDNYFHIFALYGVLGGVLMLYGSFFLSMGILLCDPTMGGCSFGGYIRAIWFYQEMSVVGCIVDLVLLKLAKKHL